MKGGPHRRLEGDATLCGRNPGSRQPSRLSGRHPWRMSWSGCLSVVAGMSLLLVFEGDLNENSESVARY